MQRLKKLLLLLTPMGAAAFVAGAGTFASFRELSEWTPSPKGSTSTSRLASTVRTKKVLLALMAIGAAAYLGGSGTFASFSAEVSNPASSIATGTLTMSDKVNTGTACLSANGATQNNVNTGCGALFNLTNVGPGVFGGVASLTIQNTGSIDASQLYVYAPQVNATLSSGISGTVSSLPINSLEGTVTSGDSLTVSWGTHTQTFAASASASGGATSISVTPQTANYAYPAGSYVSDTSSNATPSNTDCYDARTTTGANGSTNGTDLNFNSTAGNPLCGTLLFFVQETTGGNYYCWSGKGSSPQNASGLCTAPISVTLSSTLSTASPITSLPVNALNGNVASGDSIVVTQGTHTQTFTATANAPFGSTATSVSSLTPNFAYASSTATVTDSTALSSLNSDTTDTISNFDTAHPVAGRIQLYQPVGTISATLSGLHNAGVASLTFASPLTYAIPSGTQIAIAAPNAETVTTTATAAVGATSVAVTATASSHASGTAVSWAGIDTSALTKQLSRFNNGTYQRTFQIGVYFPAPAGGNQNALQGLASTFGLTWHADQ